MRVGSHIWRIPKARTPLVHEQDAKKTLGVREGEVENFEGNEEVDKEEEDHDGVPGPGVEREKCANQSKRDCSAMRQR